MLLSGACEYHPSRRSGTRPPRSGSRPLELSRGAVSNAFVCLTRASAALRSQQRRDRIQRRKRVRVDQFSQVRLSQGNGVSRWSHTAPRDVTPPYMGVSTTLQTTPARGGKRAPNGIFHAFHRHFGRGGLAVCASLWMTTAITGSMSGSSKVNCTRRAAHLTDNEHLFILQPSHRRITQISYR